MKNAQRLDGTELENGDADDETASDSQASPEHDSTGTNQLSEWFRSKCNTTLYIHKQMNNLLNNGMTVIFCVFFTRIGSMLLKFIIIVYWNRTQQPSKKLPSLDYSQEIINLVRVHRIHMTLYMYICVKMLACHDVKLQLIEVEKLNVCYKPVFVNPVTNFSYVHKTAVKLMAYSCLEL